jgi:WD40 repeat protein
MAMIAGLMVRTYVVNGWTAGATLSDPSGDTMVGLAFTPDNRRIITATQIGFAGGDAYLYAVDGTGLPIGTVHLVDEPASICVSPRAVNGSTAVVVGSWYGTSQLTMLGDSGGFSTPERLPAHASNTTLGHCGFSPDGMLLATAEHSGWVRFWNVPSTATSTPNGTDINVGSGGDAVAFAPSGGHIVAAGGKVLSIYDVTSRLEVARAMPAPAYEINHVVFTPNGPAVIAALDDCGKVLVCTNQ